MSEDEGPDSDSSSREFRRRIMRPRSRRSKEARVRYSSRTTMSLQDPMPEYVDPELVKLIAQNAPFELDVFMRSFHKSSTKPRAESGGRRDKAAKEGERRPLAVEALLSSMRERNDHLSIRKGGQDIRHSCPEGIWSDYDETDENICRATAVKRKRPKSVDSSRLPPSDRQCPSEVSFRVSDNKGRGKLRRANVSTNSSDEGSNFLEDECRPPVKTDTFDVSSTPARLPVGNDCDMLSAKPWRHGMRKGKRSAKDERQANASCCKRKAETDSRKTSEVRKYMETKMVERRKEQQQLKAEADAALAARKEQQRKLDLHQQSMFQSQGAGAKSRGHSPRPAWVFEYTSLCEPPRPWSSSSGELNTYLPPPVTPPNLEPVPLDLYATQLQFAEVRSSTPKVDAIQVQNTHARENRRSKKARGCSREVQRQLKYGRSRMMKEFPDTGLELAKLVNSPVSRKARWKAKTKLRERKVSSEEVFRRQLFDHDEPYSQRRSGDLEVYKRSLKRQFYSNGGSLCTAAKELRPQKSTSKFSTKTATKPMRPAESSLKSVIKDQARPLTKVKRLKATEHLIPGKVKELTGEELASLLNANRVPSDCERETNVTLNAQVIAERMIVGPSQTSPASEQESITDLRKCVDHSLGSPQKNSTDEDVLCKWFEPSVESSEQHVIGEVVLRENICQMLGSSFKPSKNNRAQLQVPYVKEKTGDTDIVSATSKNPTRLVRWQRMQLLKNLAEQLVKRVDEACAKKRQIEHSAVEKISSPSMDINIEPSGQPTAESGHKADSLEPKLQVDHQSNLNNGLPSIHLAGSLLGEKFQDSEPKFFHQSKQNNIINYRGLTEQEQAGFVTRSVKTDEMKSKTKKIFTSPRRARRARVKEAADCKAVGGPISEKCTMMDWTTSDKCTNITCNNAAASSSFGPSSPPSTASSSPVVLPTSTKYHMRRIKHSKMVSREAKTRQPKKEDWIIPAENDTHSIFNVYAQHLKDREKLAASTLTPILQNDLDNSATDETKTDTGIVGPAAEDDISKVSSTPLSRKFTVSESLLKLSEPMNVQRTRSADCSHESIESPVSDGTGPDLQKKHNVSSPNFGSLQKRESRADKSAVRPPPDLTNLKTNAIELAGLDPEWTILEIGDLKVCQSPTSIHLRLDRCQDNGEDRKAKEKKFVNISHGPNVGNCTEAPTNTSVGSKQETGGQCMRNLISPMKVTYARRVHSRARPDDGCTDDERVVVEWHQMNGDVPPVASQGDTKLDASEQAPTGLTCPRQNKVIGNAQSEIVETPAVKHILVNEEDSKEDYLSNKTKANGASEPIIDYAFEKKLQASDGETRTLCTMLTCQKRELSIQLNRNSKLDPQVEFRDSEEWELKLRRDQLEAELKKLDAEIMKTRAKLHQRQPMIDSQAHRVSSISLTDHPVEGAFKLDKLSNIQKRFAKYMAINDKHNDVFEERHDLQMQTIPDTHFSLKSIKDGEKTVTTSNSYSDSFISEETEVGQKILGTGKRDCLVDYLRSTENIDVYGRSLRELKTGIQQFETVLENRPQGSQSNASKKQVEVQSNCKMPRTQDEFASEGSEISTGSGPGRKLDKPPEVDCDESTARCRISIVRPVPDQMVGIDVGATRLCAKDERTTLQCQTVCSSDELLDAVHDLVNAEEKSGNGPWTPRHSNPPQTEEGIVRRNEGQTSFEQKGRNSQALPTYGAGESPSSVVQCGAQNADNSKGLTPGGRDHKSAVTANMEILPGNRTPPGIKQNGWLLKGEKGNSQSGAFEKQAEAQSQCKVLNTQDELAVEGSHISTGRGPRRLHKPPEADFDESPARHRTAKVRPVQDQMVEIDVVGGRLFAKDERTMLQSHTGCSRDGLLDAVHNLVNAEEKSGRVPWVPLPCIPQQTEDMVMTKSKGQTRFRQKGRKAQELAEYGAGESPSSVVQYAAHNSDHSKVLIPGGRDDTSAVTAGVEILPGNRTSPCIQQNGRSLKGERGNATTCDSVEVPRGPIDEQTEGIISHAAVSSTLFLSARTSEDGSERVPSIELSKLSQNIQDELASRKQTVASFQNAKTLLLAEDSSRTVTTEGLPFPLPPLGESEECIPLVPSLHHDMQTSHSPVELPTDKRFQSNTGLSNEENGQMTVNDGGNHPTCSHEGKMSDKAATTVPQFIHAACLTPLNIPCGSTAEEAPCEFLSLPSRMDFSTIREKLRNNKIATDEHPITDGWSVNSQNKSFDSPTSTTGGESSGGHTIVSESIMTSDFPLNSKDVPEISSLEFEQAAKSKCSPEMDATQENTFLTLLSRPESTNIKKDASNRFIGTQGLITPVCSTRELPSFLPSLYFHQQMTKTNVSEEVDSIISEDIEHYESDVEEESNDDVEGPASGNLGTTCTSPPPSNDFTSPTPDSGCCVGDRSLNVQVFHPESGLSVTNGPTYVIDHVPKCNPSDCIDQDLTGEVPCWASGMGSPSTLSPRCPESPLSLHAGGQKKSLASTCASPDSSGGEAVGCMQSVRATRAEDSSLQGNFRISDNYYCGSEVSESHHQSESISEELPSVDSEISSNGSGSARENIHSIDTVELSNREDINEVGTHDDGTNLHCNAMACSEPSSPDFMHRTDKQHPGSIGDIPKAAGIAKQNPDMNFLYTSRVVTANFQERARSEDNSRYHPVQFASHHESETSKPVELPLSIVLPPLRPSKHFNQYEGTYFSDALRIGKLSTKDTNFEETLSNHEEHLSTKMTELQLESAHTEALTGTLSAASLAPISSPGVMVKTLHNIFRCEQNNPGTVCTLDVARVEGYEIPVPKILDVEVICLSPHQVGPLLVSDANFSVDPAKKVDCNSEHSLIEEFEEFGQLRSETYNSSKKFTGGDSSLGIQNINMGDEVIDSAIAVPSLNISGYAGLALEKVPHQDDESLIVSIPLDCASLCAPTCRANDTPDSYFYLTSIGNENQPLGECRITKIESNKSFYSFNGEKSIGGPPASMHLVMRANRDVSSLPKTEDGDGLQNTSLKPDQIISLQSCQASTFSRPSPLFGHQKIVTDLDKDAEIHAQDKAENGQVDLQYTKTNAEFEGHADQPYSDACSLQVLQTNFPAQHDTISDSNCSNKEGFLSQSLEQISRNGLSGGVFEATVAVDLEACSSESCSSKEEVSCCEILEGVGKSGSYRVSCSGTLKAQMQSTTCLTPPHEASSCANASPKLDVRMQKDVNRAEKLDIVTDLVTSLIYEDLLSVELSGLHQEVERTPTSPKISNQTIQTANVTKTVNSKSKRSRKVSEFCQVLKHFLPTGWRSASIRHKKGLFLHVEGLKPHPLNPASKTMPETLKLNVQYPNYRESEHFPKTTNTQFLLLDVNDVYSYVQRSFELSSLILDRSPANWYDSRMPVGEDSFSALESQFWETGHISENNRWQMHKNLILDLINETLLKQFATKLLVPSLGMNTLALPAGGENLVQFVTKEILEHERYASKRGFDIEKVIAKAFEDEHWEKCSEEARDVVGDLAQGILCDLIERFVYEMVRGWGSRINQCQVLAS